MIRSGLLLLLALVLALPLTAQQLKGWVTFTDSLGATYVLPLAPTTQRIVNDDPSGTMLAYIHQSVDEAAPDQPAGVVQSGSFELNDAVDAWPDAFAEGLFEGYIRSFQGSSEAVAELVSDSSRHGMITRRYRNAEGSPFAFRLEIYVDPLAPRFYSMLLLSTDEAVLEPFAEPFFAAAKFPNH
ncbi:MAG: hypothetical protein SFY70_11270 [Bacteroidia bacterium]|nr:hypothetical protein [Bacteroidia bacterium]